MNWYYVVNGATIGPVQEGEMTELFQKGGLLPETPVWMEGMAAWVPLQESPLAKVVSKASSDKEALAPQPYANVGTRFAALLIDLVIVFGLECVFMIVPMLLTMTLVVGPNHETLLQQFWYRCALSLVWYGMWPVYETFFVGTYGATPGKMLLGIKVVTHDGGRVSYARAAARCLGKIVSWIVLFLGFLVAFWDKQRRAFHDMMCDTLVINRQP